jgi:hypothetical protein
MMARFGVALPLGSITAGWWRQEVDWSASSMLTMLIFGGMAQRGLGDRHSLIDSRRAGAPFGAMVASMADMVKGFTSV